MYRIINFKNISDGAIHLFRPVTVLIGSNGSGKTNTIEAIELLANLVHGRPLHNISDIGANQGAFQIRGGLQACAGPASSAFTLGFSFSLHAVPDKTCLYSITVNTVPTPHVYSESLLYGTETYISTTPSGTPDILNVTYNNFTRGPNPHTQLSSDRAILSRYEDILTGLSQSQKRSEAKAFVTSIRQHLLYSFVFDPNPKAMRVAERVGQELLLRDASNLASILYRLYKGSDEDKSTLKRILARIREIPDEPFTDFVFSESKFFDVTFGLHNEETDTNIVSHLLSDGTLRCLAILTALETVPINSRIVIEEFDNGLHPSRIKILTEAVWETCSRRGLNALVTTHNPATLDALTQDQLQDVVICFWDKEKKGSRLLPLMEIPSADILLERGQLGNLVTKRILEQHLSPHFDEERQKKMQEWLEALA